MKNLKDILTEGILDSDFGEDDDMLLTGLKDKFPEAQLSVSGKTLIAKYDTKGNHDIVFNGMIREHGFMSLKIDAPEEYIYKHFLSFAQRIPL